MPLAECRDCRTEVSTDSESCPKCGAVKPTEQISKDFMPCQKCGSTKTSLSGTAGTGIALMFLSFGLFVIPFGMFIGPFLFPVDGGEVSNSPQSVAVKGLHLFM